MRMSQEEFLKRAKELFDECFSLLEKKNKDYSGHDALANFFKSEDLGICEAEKAILVRLSDKFSRICNLVSNEPYVKEEQIDDTIKDMINYLVILKIILDYKRSKNENSP